VRSQYLYVSTDIPRLSANLACLKTLVRYSDKSFKFQVRGAPVVCDVKTRQLSCKRRNAPLESIEGKIRLQMLVDRTSLEIFGNDGRVYMPVGVIHPNVDNSIAVFSKGGTARITTLNVYELKLTWE